jgi:F-type H+-transporting ATPase subunit epsilon
MADTLQLELVTPQRRLFTVETPWVTLPGAEGELGILPQHVPLLTTIGSGVLRWSQGGKEQRVAVHYGYAQVANDRVTVLVEMAERREDLDATRVAAAAERAKKELRGRPDEKGEESRNKKYEAKLSRAMVRQSLL